MNRLEELIQQLCPNGVEYKPLGEVFKSIKTGKLNANAMTVDGEYPFFTCDEKPYRIDTFAFDTEAIIISGNGSQVGHISYYNGKFNAYQRTYVLSCLEDGSIFYCFHYLKAYLREYIYKFAKKGSVPYITLPMLEGFLIPLPPLPVQEEIVRLLDQLTETTQKYQAELEAEQDARKKQYEEYLNSFFGYDFDDLLANKEIKGYQIMPLSELGTLTRGKRFVRDDVKASGQPCIHYGDLYTHYGIIADVTKTYLDRDFPKKMRYAQKGDVVIVGAGENDWDIGIGLVWNGEEPAAVHDACYILQHQMNPKYISYYLRSACYHLQIKKYVSTGKICSISSEGIGKALIPIPSLEKQQRIVNILDRMDKAHKELCQSIETEIRMRKQQYEYYRNQLLDFKKKEG